MKKLLHERLRDGSFRLPDHPEELADEIERDYIPRPRFEDGEPLQWGDMVEGYPKPIIGMKIFKDGSGCVGDAFFDDKDWIDFNTIMAGELKRPQPKVLDAEGIEIKVGDTVWNIENGHEYEVTKLPTPGGMTFYTVELLHKLSGMPSAFKPDRLTHKEPDSLEKLRDDMEKFNAYLKTYDQSNNEVNAFADRLSALIERGA